MHVCILSCASGKQILVDGTPLHLKGIAWNPVPKGGAHPADLNFAAAVEEDAKLMQQMGINAVARLHNGSQFHVPLESFGSWACVESIHRWASHAHVCHSSRFPYVCECARVCRHSDARVFVFCVCAGYCKILQPPRFHAFAANGFGAQLKTTDRTRTT